jgi:APA family basic amino acid/polyamine antiporter
VLVLAGNFNEIVSYFIFIVVVFIGLSVAALFKFRRDDANGVRFLTPGYPVTPIVFLVMLVVLLVLLAGNNPRQALLGVAVVWLGLPVYLFLYRNKRLVERETTQ